MKRKIEENFSFLEHLIAVKLESITYTRFVFIYFLEYRFYHSPSKYHRYLAMFYFILATISFSRVQFQNFNPSYHFLSSSYFWLLATSYLFDFDSNRYRTVDNSSFPTSNGSS